MSSTAFIGPAIPAGLTAGRYAAAVAVVLVVFAIRAALTPMLGVQSPLLPFLLAVLACAFLGGRGPALLASGITPVLATIWFTNWPNDAPPGQWLAHVAFFLVLAVLSAFIMDALQKAVRRAEEAAATLRENDRRKDDFLAMLSHELRNPLTPIRNVAHILGRGSTDAATVRQAARMLERQALRLTKLVDDLLDVASITQRRVTLKHEVVSLEDVLARALEGLQSTLDARRQTVTTNVAALHVHVQGDVNRLCQVVANLLGNASKYSPEGRRIHVKISGDAALAELSVRDEGMGIDAQMQPRLFDSFMQGDRSLDRAQDGLGVGLTIAKHLLEMQGGTIEAHSAGLGHGSEFRIRLPRVDRPAQSRRVLRSPERARRRQRVLVVEDNRDCADSIRDVLRTDGHEVRVANDGTAALASLDDFSPDIVLLDVGLPHMDGFMVAHAIRARQSAGAAPPRIVALTGHGRAEDRQSALRSGFDDHLIKPVEPERLLRLVSEAPGLNVERLENPHDH